MIFCGNHADRYVYESLPAKGSIRLLKLHRQASKHTTASLIATTIEEAPAFYALSYCWGSKKRRCPIEVDGKTLLVTPTLLACLKELSEPEHLKDLEPRSEYIWIDQICINQEDVEERGRQVQQMDRVYMGSIRTLIWLEIDSPTAEAALRLLERAEQAYLTQYPPVDGRRIVPEANHTPDLERHGLPGWSDPAWKPVIALLRNRWFTRIWVLQEAVVSREDPIMLCGSSTCAFGTVAWSCDWLVAAGMYEYRYLRKPIWITNIRTMHLYRLDARNRNLEALFAETLCRFRATDPRDKVYSLLGIAKTCGDPKEPAVDIAVDYTLSPEEVLRNFTRALIVSKRSLGALLLSGAPVPLHTQSWRERKRRRRGRGRGHRSPEPASWAINPEPSQWIPRQFRTLTRQGDGGMTRVVMPFASAAFASKARLPEVEERAGDDMRIALKGFSVDSVAVASRHLWLPCEAGGQVERRSDALHSCLDYSLPVYAARGPMLVKHYRACLRSPRLAYLWGMALEHGSYHDDLDALVDAFVHCLTGGMSFSTKDADAPSREAFIDILQARGIVSPLDDRLRKPRPSASRADPVVAKGETGSEAAARDPAALDRASQQFRWATGRCTFHKFFVTAKGHIGTTSADVKAGDSVAVMLGGATPYLLRRAGDSWTFLAPCLIYEYALGQVIDDWYDGKIADEMFTLR